MPDWTTLFDALADAGIPVSRDTAPRPAAGGDSSPAWRIQAGSGAVFLKTGGTDDHDMFAAEAEGLAALGETGEIRVPAVLGCACTGVDSFIALEWLELEPASPASDELLGRQLAALHRHRAERHGFARDNTIGRTPQINSWREAWVDFYGGNRLGFQLDLAARNGFRGELQALGARLTAALPDLLAAHRPVPSLLHGDLWSGNRASSGGRPVVFDPAAYYGDRETDLAMTRLFGGFSANFYAAYRESWPLPEGHRERLPVYQLYHVLNHLNLFGKGYLGRAEALMVQALERAD